VPAEYVVLLISGALAVIGLAALALARRLTTGPTSTFSAPATGASVPAAQSAARGDAVIDLLDVAVVHLDAGFEVTAASPAATRLLLGDGHHPVGQSLIEIFLDHRVEEAARTAAAEGAATVETSLRGPEERRVVIRIRRLSGGTLVMLLDDVTELRRLQRIRSEFIDNLSHELRTPLTTIRLLSETLGQDLEHAEVPPRIRERINKIDVETGHLVQMVNELLDLSRIEGGAAELHFESVNMAEVIGAALDRLRTFADRQGVTLTSDLPPTPLPRVRGDGERLNQVLVNLLHNAVKFSSEGSVVTVAAHELEGAVAVEVRDHGVGIPAADLVRVFERFYKVDKARLRGQGGTGLGLSIARHIVEGHGGRIWVESEEGRGSVFTFTVPITQT
jgi:two-component system phosphate regulon sensor histidine kinase PhoR